MSVIKTIPKSYIDADNLGTLGSLYGKFHVDWLTCLVGVREETYIHTLWSLQWDLAASAAAAQNRNQSKGRYKVR